MKHICQDGAISSATAYLISSAISVNISEAGLACPVCCSTFKDYFKGSIFQGGSLLMPGGLVTRIFTKTSKVATPVAEHKLNDQRHINKGPFGTLQLIM